MMAGGPISTPTRESIPTAARLPSTGCRLWNTSRSGAAAWRAPLRTAGTPGLLVAAHFGVLVERKTAVLLERGDTNGARSAQAFRAEMERLQAAWREALTADSRYQPFSRERPGKPTRCSSSVRSGLGLPVRGPRLARGGRCPLALGRHPEYRVRAAQRIDLEGAPVAAGGGSAAPPL